MTSAARQWKRRHQVRNVPQELHWYETDQAGGQPAAPEQLVDVGDGDAVRDFTHRYLEAHSQPPNEDEVHNVTATISRYKGPRIVRSATLESFLAGLLAMEHA
jgi:hypothetical protein